MENKTKIIIVIGPTASGKSDYAVNLALRVNGEIISSDSRQVYKDLNIGSGKITKKEMKGVTHYGLDIAKPEKKFTSADFMIYAQDKIKNILSKNKIPIICGGTGMYIDALLYGIEDNPPPDYNSRKELESKTLQEIQELLKVKGGEFFNSLNNSEKNNKARLIRKLELNNLKVNTSYIKSFNKLDNKETSLKEEREVLYDAEIHILNPSKEILKEKIEKRLEKRLENDAMIAEIKDLIECKDLRLEINYTEQQLKERMEQRINWLLSLGLEYRYVTEYITRKISFEEMKKTLNLKIYQYAKRQMTWNKRYTKSTDKNLKIIKVNIF